MSVGWSIAFTIKFFLVYPKKEKRIFGKRIPFTPGFFYRKKLWLINKLEKALNDYLNESISEDENTRIAKWELKAYRDTWDKFDFIDNIIIIPKSFRDNIRLFFAGIVYELVKQFLRTFIPFLMTKYEISKYIQLLDKKLDIEIVKQYFNKYVYKFLLVFLLSVSFAIGLFNGLINFIIFWSWK